MTRILTQINAYQVGIFQGPLLVLGILLPLRGQTYRLPSVHLITISHSKVSIGCALGIFKDIHLYQCLSAEPKL